MSNLTDLISAGGGGTLFTIPVTKSTTWTPPFDGTAVIHCIGAGASGGVAKVSNAYPVASGGAGGYSRKVVTLSTGTNWTMVVGAGGASHVDTSGTSGGASGGNTTATDGSSSLTANGGNASAAGGTASGGDVNNTGGAGATGNYILSGGAVGVLGTGNAGAGQNRVNVGSSTRQSFGGHSDVMSPQFENTNGELRGGGAGGRNGARFSSSSGNAESNMNGGFLAGGGGFWSGGDNVAMVGGDGGIGGGGGSCAYPNGSGAPPASGAGGNGLIIVMYTAIG